jgi:hypothetical protein
MSTNLLVWNPGAANQEDDATYAADVQRSGGATTDAIFASPLANKLFYQLSTFCAAFAQALVAKGYTVSDANLAALQAVLSNVLTNADMPLPVAKGGTGATTLDGLVQLLQRVDMVNQQAASQALGVTTPATPRVCRVTAEGFVYSPSGTSVLAYSLGWKQAGHSTIFYENVLTITAAGISQVGRGSLVVFPDVTYAMPGTVSFTQGGIGDYYDLHVRLEVL